LIFVTVGTHHQPFDRLLDALANSGLEDLVVQHGPGRPPPNAARSADYLPFEEMLACFREAEAVITHAGVGSILCATREGHTPLVVPRRHDLGEHVDDHQVELTRALEGRGSVVAVWDTARIPELLEAAPQRRAAAEPVEPELCAAVRGSLAQSSDA
jgi:UDP-N-acetylglucosamine transferase subunit ALG13